MQVIIPVGYRKDFPVMKKPQTFLPLANRELFQEILKKFPEDEVIVVTPFPECFKHYEVQVVKDDGKGSAAALKKVERLVEGPFLVHFSDIFTPFKPQILMNYHMANNAKMTIAIVTSRNPSRYGVVSTDPAGRVVRYLLRPRQDLIFSTKVFAGIFVLNPEIFDKIPYEMTVDELLTYLLHTNQRVFAYEFRGIWYRIGSVQEYVEANADFLARKMESHAEEVRGVNIYPPVNLIDVEAAAAFIGPYVSARNVTIGSNVKIRNSVILDGAEIGDNVSIVDSVIGPRAVIGSGAVITESLIGEGSIVGENSRIGKSVIGIEKEVRENVFELQII